MRITADPRDDTYSDPKNLHRRMRPDVAIYLDGVRQEYVITADEEKGYLIRYQIDGKGRVTGETEVVAGRVQIVFWADRLTTVRPI